ncbi:MAG: threonine/serine exporter family protein [Anaerococcus sp.]|nr:threonine/serine exporter family protein [Anaerococcus sp.]
MDKEIIENMDQAAVLSEVASNAGAIMLQNGAEIYRVEDTIERIIKSKENIRDVDVYSTSNVIVLSFSLNGKIHTNVRRVKARRNNLYYIDKVNSFSRRFVAGDFNLDEALVELRAIKNDPGYSPRWQCLGSSLSAGAFLLLLRGRLEDMVLSFFVGLISYAISHLFEKAKFGFFLINFIAGIVVSLITMTFGYFFTGVEVNKVVVASMMAFLPGITLTNSMRDLMSGDVTSGLTGATTAFLISTALALGVALPITIATYLG